MHPIQTESVTRPLDRVQPVPPGYGRPRHGAPVARRVHLLAVAVAAVYVAGSLADGGFPPQVLAAGTVVVWWAVVVGLALGGWPRAPVPRWALAAGAFLAGLAGLTALSLGWASDDGAAFLEAVRAAGYLGLFALVVLAAPRGSARGWLAGLALGLVALACLALASRVVPGLGDEGAIAEALPLAADRLSYPIGYWNGLAAALAAGLVLLGWLGARAATPLGRSLSVGALPVVALTLYLTLSRGGVLAAVVGVSVLLALGPERRRLLGAFTLGGLGSLALVVAVGRAGALIDGVHEPTAAGVGWEALVAILVVSAGVGLLRHGGEAWIARRAATPVQARSIFRPRPRVPASLAAAPRPVLAALAAVAALAVVAGGAAALDPGARLAEFKRAEGTGSEADGDGGSHFLSARGSGRFQTWGAAVDAFASDPLRGIGAAGYEAWWYRNATIPQPVRNAHSLPLETLAELGAGGLALLGGFLALGGVAAWHRRHVSGGEVGAAAAILAAGLVSASIEWTWELPAVFGIVVVAVALLVGAATEDPDADRRGEQRGDDGAGGSGEAGSAGQRQASGEGRGRPGAVGLGYGAATVLAGWLAVAAAATLFLGEERLSRSEREAASGDYAAAAQEARDAATLQPWAAEPWLQLGLVQELAGDLDGATASLAEAVERASENWRIWAIAARVDLRKEDFAAADRAFARLEELIPLAADRPGGFDPRDRTPPSTRPVVPRPDGGLRGSRG